jgi:hypothetical protein
VIEETSASADGIGQVPQIGELQLTGDAVGGRPQPDDAVPVGQVEGAAVGPVSPLLDPGHARGHQMAEQIVGAKRGPEGQAERQRPWGHRLAAGSSAGEQVARDKAKTCWTVSLNIRTVANPAATATSVIDKVGGLDQDPSSLGPLCPGQSEGSGLQLGPEMALDLARPVRQSSREAANAFSVYDDAVGDEAHGPGQHVGAVVPLR